MKVVGEFGPMSCVGQHGIQLSCYAYNIDRFETCTGPLTSRRRRSEDEAAGDSVQSVLSWLCRKPVQRCYHVTEPSNAVPVSVRCGLVGWAAVASKRAAMSPRDRDCAWLSVVIAGGAGTHLSKS